MGHWCSWEKVLVLTPRQGHRLPCHTSHWYMKAAQPRDPASPWKAPRPPWQARLLESVQGA